MFLKQVIGTLNAWVLTIFILFNFKKLKSMCHAENVEWIDFGELFIDTGFFENMRTLKEKNNILF